MKVIVVGGGCFGLSTAIELRQRGHQVTLIERTNIPNSYAASEDISKLIRMSYGDDPIYTEMMDEAFPMWDEYNREFGELFHRTGILFLKQKDIVEGTFEHESIKVLESKNIPYTLLNAEQIRNRYPAWNYMKFPHAYFNATEGWAESGRVVQKLAEKAVDIGVRIEIGEVKQLLLKYEDGQQIVEGVLTKNDKEYRAELVVMASGAWTPFILPHLKKYIRSTGQVVFHFQPEDPTKFSPDVFPPWTGDISDTGFYGFPMHHQYEGRVKVGHHGNGYTMERMDNEHIDEVLKSAIPRELERYRRFIKESIPSLWDARVVKARLCFYCDSFDGDFFIDYDPLYKGLFIATGDSGHGFKFTPIIGKIAADVIEKKPNKYSHRFRYREEPNRPKEHSRYVEDNTISSL